MTRFLDFGALLPHLPSWGISRVADTTYLDRTGIPTASAVKPGTGDAIWIYSGKGTTQDRARVVAVFECLERTLSLWPEAPTAVPCRRAGAKDLEYWAPRQFTQSRTAADMRDAAIPWVLARKHDTCEQVVVPAHAVYNGHPPAWADESPFGALTSNGLAAHTTADAAVEAALCEVIERHTVSLTEVLAAHGPYLRLAALASRLGLEPEILSGFQEDHTFAVTIDPVTIPASCRKVLKALENAGLHVTIKRLPSDVGVPTYAAAAAEASGLTEFLACAGYGTRLRHEEALMAALLELAQTRATDLQGAREDRYLPEKQRIPRLPHSHWLLDPGPQSPFVPDDLKPGGEAGSAVLLSRRLEQAGFGDWAVHWFDAPDGVHACRVVVPGLETWHATAGASHFGPELQRKLSE